ncbi:hypothetical protein K502DRAFT_368435 [Neoconidiobolus thromboides FSU 785]|nr:hypothetical protein K502DRAFT_368435 [Neoconidiobolus thromboides FSU 785]
MKSVINSEDLYYCSICKLSTEGHKKHYYTKKHIENVKYQLSKIKQNFDKHLLFLEEPLLSTDGSEQPLFYCGICQRELKTKKLGLQFIADFIYLHWNHQTHFKKVNYFWELNKAYLVKKTDRKGKEKEMFKKEEFWLNKKEWEKYQDKCKEILIKYKVENNIIDEFDLNKNREGDKIEVDNEKERSFKSSSLLLQKVNIKRERDEVDDICINNNIRKNRTIKLSDLPTKLKKISRVKPKEEFKNVNQEGNVPPWMTTNITKSPTPFYGPSIEGFLKKIKKKNSKISKILRQEEAGINNENNKENNELWLPKFGRVWSNESRKQQLKQFLENKK